MAGIRDLDQHREALVRTLITEIKAPLGSTAGTRRVAADVGCTAKTGEAWILEHPVRRVAASPPALVEPPVKARGIFDDSIRAQLPSQPPQHGPGIDPTGSTRTIDRKECAFCTN